MVTIFGIEIVEDRFYQDAVLHEMRCYAEDAGATPREANSIFQSDTYGSRGSGAYGSGIIGRAQMHGYIQ